MDWTPLVLLLPSVAMICICAVSAYALWQGKAAIDIHFNGAEVKITDAQGEVSMSKDSTDP